MYRRFILAGMLVLAPVTSIPAQPEQSSVQQQFESASGALAEARWEEALTAFQALENRLLGSGNERNLAIVRVRKAAALAGLQRRDEAAEALRLGLPGLPAEDASLAEDRFLGLRTLGELAELSLDYADARRHFETARAVEVEPRLKLTLYRGLIQTQMFADPEAALASADEALALAQQAEADREAMGLLHTFRGRVLLNLGRHREARSALYTALQRLGGLTTSRIGLSDIVSRSDLAIAALLAGDEEDARRYLAYTGAGRFESGLSPTRGNLRPPRCGDGIRPDDVVVVEYSILDDGSVGRATPIYASRSGDLALTFARAVLDWSWDPESFGEMPRLLRTAMRVELRCAHTERFGSELGTGEIRQWAAAHGAEWPQSGRFRPVALVRGDLAREESSREPDQARMVILLSELAMHWAVGRAETADIVRRTLPIAVAEGAPPALITTLLRLSLQVEQDPDRRAIDFSNVLELPFVRSDPRRLASVRLAQAAAYFWAGNSEQAANFADLALATSGLPADDEVRSRIHQLKAGLAAREGDMEAARASYAAAGPSADSCGILPRLRNPGTSSSDFPGEAMRWGFEGWATVETFILPDGSATGPRTLMAYPPFVFADAAEDLADRRRYDRYFTPQSEGCPNLMTVTFRIRE